MAARRRDFLKLAAAAAWSAPAAESRAFNLLFLMSDQHNPHVLGCGGDRYARTPNLDRLARQGSLFTNAYCTYPICVPARQSILTGKYPHHNGAYSIRHILDEREFTIADRFQQAGHRTAAFGKMHFLDQQARHGFQEHVEFGSEAGAATAPDIRGDPRFERDRRIYAQITSNILRGGPAVNWAEEAVAERARQFLRDHRSEPFCAWVSFGLPHWHWVCAPQFYYMYDPATLPLPASFRDDLAGSPFARRALERRGWAALTEEQTRLCRARYYGATSAMDHYIGLVVKELDALGLAERTLVVYTSDHGEMCGEHRLWDKAVFFEAAARIPLIMRLPGRIPAGRVAHGLISHVDLLPSILSLQGWKNPLPAPIDGQDFSGLLLGKNPEGREYLFSEMNLDESGSPGAILARWKQWSYFQYREDAAELYDLKADPDQMKNLAADSGSSEVVKHLQGVLARFVGERLRPQFPPRAAPDSRPPAQKKS